MSVHIDKRRKICVNDKLLCDHLSPTIVGWLKIFGEFSQCGDIKREVYLRRSPTNEKCKDYRYMHFVLITSQIIFKSYSKLADFLPTLLINPFFTCKSAIVFSITNISVCSPFLK